MVVVAQGAAALLASVATPALMSTTRDDAAWFVLRFVAGDVGCLFKRSASA